MMWGKAIYRRLLFACLFLVIPAVSLGSYRFRDRDARAKAAPIRLDSSRYDIMGQGQATPEMMYKYARQYSKVSPQKLKYIIRLYIWESHLEGVNHDVAFVQMCHETNFLRFGRRVDPNQNNFCGLKTLNYADIKGAYFFSIKDGVRAHIQHLKAYGSRAPLKCKCIDPRFDLIPRGIAKNVHDLTGRWAVDGNYGNALEKKIDVLLSMR